VKTDSVVQTYSKQSEENPPTDLDLKEAKREYQQTIVIELFDFKLVNRYFQRLHRVFLEYDLTIPEAALERFLAIEGKAEAELIEMAKRFLPQLHNYFREEAMPENNEQLQLRLQKAGNYFSNKITKEILPEITSLDVITDNQAVRDNATEGIKNLIKELMTKAACFANCKTAFSIKDYIKTKLDIALNDKIGRTVSSLKTKSSAPSAAEMGAEDSDHPELYQNIRKWRDLTASLEGRKPYTIIAVRTLYELTKYLPTTEANLKKMSGIGKVKVDNYGEDIIDLIKQYVAEKGIDSDQMPVKVKKPPTKTPTKQISYDAFRGGKSIGEIAKERDLAEGTIINHLGYFVGTGEIHIHEIVDKDKVELIATYMKANEDKSLKEVKDHFGERASYGELNMVRSHLTYEESGGTD